MYQKSSKRYPKRTKFIKTALIKNKNKVKIMHKYKQLCRSEI
uniref:Uncharacterized protein n=1 Tax=Rhizophora mucronata TaxID=61149 RepID=A0A2P2MG93_RHIMU